MPTIVVNVDDATFAKMRHHAHGQIKISERERTVGVLAGVVLRNTYANFPMPTNCKDCRDGE